MCIMNITYTYFTIDYVFLYMNEYAHNVIHYNVYMFEIYVSGAGYFQPVFYYIYVHFIAVVICL